MLDYRCQRCVGCGQNLFLKLGSSDRTDDVPWSGSFRISPDDCQLKTGSNCDCGVNGWQDISAMGVRDDFPKVASFSAAVPGTFGGLVGSKVCPPPQTWNHATPSFTVLGPPCPIPIYSRGNCREKQNWQRGRETKAEGILNQQLEAEAILQTSFIFKWRVNGSLGLRPAFAWRSHQFLMMQHLPFKWIIYRWSTVCQIWIHCQPRLLAGFEHDESWIVHKLRWLP